MQIEIGTCKDCIYIGQLHGEEIFEISTEQSILISKNKDEQDNPIVTIISNDKGYSINVTLETLKDIVKHVEAGISSLNESFEN
jgi:hypothetical protein